MAAEDLIKTARLGRVWVLANDFVRAGMGDQRPALLDEVGQVAQLAILHDEIDVSLGLDAVVEGHDVGVSKGREDLDLAVEVLLELFVQAAKVHGLDGYQTTGNLGQASC